jgi:hypothetical protein
MIWEAGGKCHNCLQPSGRACALSLSAADLGTCFATGASAVAGLSRYRARGSRPADNPREPLPGHRVPDYQPGVWTAIEFEAPEHSAPALADQLADALLEPGWYANWNSDTEATVVFPKNIFRYRHGDAAARAAAQQHGRQCRVPESQLDWTD